MLCNSKHPTSIQRFKTLEQDLKISHRNKYTYDKSIFVNTSTKMLVTCPDHGDFLITPAKHLQGQGCKACGNINNGIRRRLDTNSFLDKLHKLQPTLGTAKVNYIDSKTKVEVTCPTHGSFFATPNKLLQGRSCPSCKGTKIAQKLIKPFQTFLKEANAIHQGKYTYLAETYVNARTAMDIVCPIHGIFHQTPDTHLRPSGCKKCAHDAMKVDRALTKEEFIKKADIVHYNKYDYSKVVYKNNSTDVTIICPHHGEFTQTPGNHLASKGCHICNCTWAYTDSPTILYYLKLSYSNQTYYKVGITKHTILKRFYAELNAGYSIQVLYHFRFLNGKDAWELEQSILKSNQQYRANLSTPFLTRGAGDGELFTTDIRNLCTCRIS